MSNSYEENSQKLRLQVITWNVANTDPKSNKIPDLLRNNDDIIDVYAIGMQEIPTGVMETAKSFLLYDIWAKALMNVLCCRGYFMVESVRMQGLSLSIFVLQRHVPFVRFIKTALERSGFGGFWGNKGGVAVSLWLYGRKVCFLNTHLLPHRTNSAGRVEQFKTIVDKVSFAQSSSVLSHDCLFWLGDLNFRLNDLTRDEVLRTIEKAKHVDMLKYDQFSLHHQYDDLLKQFHEGNITFPPTYKFDMGTDTYDTSEKQRVPAWTDRILYRLHPEFLTQSTDEPSTSSTTNRRNSDNKEASVDDGMLLLRRRSNRKKFVDLIEGSYTSDPCLKQSDHKPVKAQYNVEVHPRHFPALVEIRLVEAATNPVPSSSSSSSTLTLTTNQTVKIEVRLEENFTQRYYDYIALYPEPVTDHRSYMSWIYMPNYDQSEPDRTCFRFGFPPVDEAGVYRIGYYSELQTCLLALSPPFTVNEA